MRRLGKKVRINVTQEDIDNGKPGMASACPIALASIRRAGWEDEMVDTDEPVMVGLGVLGFYDGDVVELVYSMPPKAVDFIMDFDEGRPVKPFSFTAERVA